MKTKLPALFMLFFSLPICFVASVATQKVSVIKDGHLIISEIIQLADVPNIPKELRDKPEIAAKLYLGEQKEEVIKDAVGKSKFRLSFSPPFVVEINILQDKKISFQYKNNRDSGWKIENLPLKSEEVSSAVFALLAIFAPVACMLIVSIDNRYKNIGTPKLMTFFGSMLFSASVVSVVIIANPDIGGTVIILTAVVGIIASTFTGWRASGDPLLSFFASFFVTLFTPIFTVGDVKFPFDFLLFLAVIQTACFFVAHYGVRYWKRRKKARLQKIAQMYLY